MSHMSSSSVKELSPVEKELSIVIPGEAIKSEMDKAYTKLSHQAKLKGFRQGKVPRNVLEHYYSAQVERDVLNRLLGQSYREAVTDNALEVVSEPKIETNNAFLVGVDFSFTAKVEVKPEVVLAKWEGLDLSVPDFVVDDAAINQELERLRSGQAAIVPVTDRTSIQQGDLVECSHSGTVAGAPVKALTGIDHSIEVGAGHFFPVVEQALIGAQVGSKVEINFELPSDFAQEDLRGQTAHLTVSIKGIKVKQKPDLDDEFAKDLSDQFSTLDDLKNAIRTAFLAQKEHREADAKKGKAIEALIAHNPVQIPSSMIERQAEQQAMMALSSVPRDQAQKLWQAYGAQFKEEAKPQAQRTVHASLLCDAIAKAQALEVSADEIDAELEKEAKRMRITKNQLRGYYKDGDFSGIKGRLLAEKALALVVEKAHITTHSESLVA